ncbi:MAG: hypothetical protein JWQ72_1222 [Polaromonas sp.]|nr:hypothetical protein [Polaromonas sp.]
MKLFAPLVSLVSLLLPLVAWAAAPDICTLKPGVLQVAVAGTFPPVVMTGKNGKLSGMDVDFLSRFARENKLKMEWVVVPFEGIWKLPAEDRADIGANGISPLESRQAEGMTFSEPYYKVLRSLVIRKADRSKYHTVKDFEGKKIGYVAGAIPELDLKKNAPASTILVPVASFAAGMEALGKKELEAVGEGNVTGLYIARINPAFAVIDQHEYDPAHSETLTYAVRNKGCGLQERLNTFIQTRDYPSGKPRHK